MLTVRQIHRLALAAGACIALTAAGCGGDEDTQASEQSSGGGGGPITIGMLSDQSGRFVSVGQDIEAATELAIAEINRAGGVNGCDLELRVEDTGGNPATAASSMQGLADAGAAAVLGPISSQEAEVAFAQAGRLEIPIATGTANKEGITDIARGWALRNTATNTDIYEVAMQVWQEKYGVRSAVLVFDESEAVSAAAAQNAIPAVAEKLDVAIDETITITTGQSDFATVVQRLKEADVDGAIIMGAPGEVGLLAKEMGRQNVELPVLGHPSQTGDVFFERGGQAINDWVLPSIFDIDSPEADTKAYISAVGERDPEPPTIPEAANYYDLTKLIAKVLTDKGVECGAPVEEVRTAIRDGLLSVEGYDGVAGDVSFGGSPDAEKTVYVDVVQGGERQPLD